MAHAVSYGCGTFHQPSPLPLRLRSQVYSARTHTEQPCSWLGLGEGARSIDSRHAAEVAMLEQKLWDTKRRHDEELARILEAPDGHIQTSVRQDVFTQTQPVRTEGVQDARSSGGPVLAARRKGNGMRMWVEDCSSLGIVRVHAMHEATGLRNFVDVADDTLSTLISSYRWHREAGDPSLRDNTSDLDICLDILLESICVFGPVADGVLELSIPSPARLCASAAETAAHQVRLRDLADPWSDGFHHGAVSSGHDACEQRYVPSRSWRPESATSSSSMRPEGFKSTLADLSVADCDAIGESAIPGSSTTSAKSAHRRQLVRPHSAPHSSRRPQSARHTGREAVDRVYEQLLMDMRLSAGWSESSSTPRRRKPRPTSAKALKHRRVVDDGVDSIIYEDVEEEAEASDHGDHLQEHPGRGHEQGRSGTGGCGSNRSSSKGSVSSRSLSRPRPSVTLSGTAPTSAVIQDSQALGSQPFWTGARSRASSVRSERSLTFEDEAVSPPPRTPANEILDRSIPCRPSRGRPGARRPSFPSESFSRSPMVSATCAHEVFWTRCNGQPSTVVPRLGGRTSSFRGRAGRAAFG